MIDNHRHPVHIPNRSGAKVGNGTTAMVESTVRLLLKRRSDGPKGRGIAVKSDKISLPTRDAGFIDDLLDRRATAGVLGISVRTRTDGIGLASARQESDMPDRSGID